MAAEQGWEGLTVAMEREVWERRTAANMLLCESQIEQKLQVRLGALKVV